LVKPNILPKKQQISYSQLLCTCAFPLINVVKTRNYAQKAAYFSAKLCAFCGLNFLPF
jgi:hypothetical protein